MIKNTFNALAMPKQYTATYGTRNRGDYSLAEIRSRDPLNRGWGL